MVQMSRNRVNRILEIAFHAIPLEFPSEQAVLNVAELPRQYLLGERRNAEVVFREVYSRTRQGH